MPLMKCIKNGENGWKFGNSGACYIGTNAKQEAIKQGIAMGEIKADEDYYIDDLIMDDIIDFIPPPYPENMPEKYVKILKSTYNSVRSEWVKNNPRDPENKENKARAAKIAWNAVKETGYEKPKDEVKKTDNVFRYDVFDVLESTMSEPFRLTSEGYLKGRAIIANTGIQSYKQQDGSILRELRTPEDVGEIDALNSYKNIVITNGHPKDGVNSENAKELQVGFTGSDVRFDGHAISIDMTITDKKTIDEIKQYGKYAISAGYNADLEFKNGFAFGNNEYNAIQKNIRANHLAVNIDRARAGDLARMRLRMDSLDAIHIDTNVVGDNKLVQKEKRTMAKIKINDVEFETDARVAEEFNLIRKDNDELNKKLIKKDEEYSKLQADKDSAEDKLKTANKDIEKLKKDAADETKIQQKVKDRIALVDIAVKNEVEIKEDMTDSEIKKAIILKAFPNAKLEDKDESYLNARYDSAIELLDAKLQAENKENVLNIKKNDKKENKDSVEVIERRRLKNLWKLNSDQAESYRNGNLTDEILKILDSEERR